jgi:predicted phosphate transport protein (TIGR00153 family)
MRFRLLPTDDRFFALFDEVAANAVECARRLRDLVADTMPSDHLNEVLACEHRGDELTKEILQRLDASFVTPFYREDIHQLAESLDDVVDDMQDVAGRLHLTVIGEVIPDLVDQADLLVRMAEETAGLVGRLSTMKGVAPYLEAIDKLESDGDAVFRQALARLFSGDYDALDVVRWKDIVEAMEAALNTLEDVSNVIESIVLKHA